MAAGSDGICREIMQAVGQPYAQALGGLVRECVVRRILAVWRGEDSQEVPRWEAAQLAELSCQHLCSGSWEDICASLRSTTASCLRLLAGELQACAVSGGGAQFAIFCARLFQRLAASCGLSRSAHVADLRGACYSAMLEFGPTITSREMRQFWAHSGFAWWNWTLYFAVKYPQVTRPRDQSADVVFALWCDGGSQSRRFFARVWHDQNVDPAAEV